MGNMLNWPRYDGSIYIRQVLNMQRVKRGTRFDTSIIQHSTLKKFKVFFIVPTQRLML
jgi:hypothetical protein